MNTTQTRKTKKARKAYHVAKLGRVKVPIYKRRTPTGSDGFLVVNYSTGKRKFDSYPTAELAIEAALKLARQMSERQVVAAAMTNAQASEYAASVQKLAPFGVGLLSAAAAVAECFKHVTGLADLIAAVKDHAKRNKHVTAKRVADAVAELLQVKAQRGASVRHVRDLRSRLERFAGDCVKDCGNVTTGDVQAWLDGLKLAPQSYKNYRTVLHSFFVFCVAHSYCVDNPVDGVERVKVNGGDVEVFTPQEITRLLAAASNDFLPVIALGAFAGLRSAEIERLEMSDVHLAERHIVVGASKAKTASRRIVPITENLAEWLRAYAGRKGKVWHGTIDTLHRSQQVTAAATEVKADPEKGIKAQKPVTWKANALRHSFASYSFALTHDAGRIAGFLGNSASVVHKFYRELVSPKAAQQWFSIVPEGAIVPPALPDNVLALPAAVNA